MSQLTRGVTGLCAIKEHCSAMKGHACLQVGGRLGRRTKCSPTELTFSRNIPQNPAVEGGNAYLADPKSPCLQSFSPAKIPRSLAEMLWEVGNKVSSASGFTSVVPVGTDSMVGRR